MKHSSKPSVSGTSNETFLKTESASSLQGSAEPSSPDTSISNGGKTHPSKIDALKNWFRTRPIVEKFCALPAYIQSWGLTLFFMGTATIIAFCFFHALKNPTANIALTYILAVFLVARFTDGYSFGLFSSFVGVVCVNFLFTYPYFALDFTMTGYPITFVAMFSISSITSAITSNMKTQARVLAEREKMLMEAEKEKMRANLLRAISHDLRTPLTSILGYLQLLEDPGLTEGERREYLAVIAGRARTLQSLITSFYDLSRLEGGEYLLQREKVDLYASLSGLLAAFYNDFTDRGFDMEVELAEGLPQVWADAGAVLRIFTNLIRNALEHGEGRMEIRLYQEGGQVVSRFSNETHALTAEDVPHVFDRFFTSDKMRTGRNTGLGLAIVKALAGQMDCRAEAALEGDMFAITLRWPVERR